MWVGEPSGSLDLIVLHYRDASMLELRFGGGGTRLRSIADFVASVLGDLVWNQEPAFACPAGQINEAVLRSGLRSEPVIVEPGPTVEELALLGTPVVSLGEIAIDLDVEGVMTPAMANALRSQIAAWLRDAGVTSAVLADR
ncbi:MAG: hypothetical protein GY925_00835 [Actinomycetia bacterium]|nr:hypothetical protein [Actinomycetes bacterium]